MVHWNWKSVLGSRSFFKFPWKITGPVSSPEYVEPMLNIEEFRKFAPASYPVKPVIPNSENNKIYEIAYFPRDYRRKGIHVKYSFDPKSFLYDSNNDKLDMELPPTPGPYFVMGRVHNINDNPFDGYQK